MSTETWKLTLHELKEDYDARNVFLLVVAGKEEYKTTYEIVRNGQVWSEFQISDVDGPNKAVEMYRQFQAGFEAYECISEIDSVRHALFMDL